MWALFNLYRFTNTVNIEFGYSEWGGGYFAVMWKQPWWTSYFIQQRSFCLMSRSTSLNIHFSVSLRTTRRRSPGASTVL